MATVNHTLDFLIIGAGKSGTTTLADMLSRHPDIAMARPKEPWFFDSRDFEQGMQWYWQRYLGHFAGEPCVGEASSQTLFVPYTAQRLGQVLPQAKLLAILRDPVERAHSDWWMKYCTGLEADDFPTAIARNLQQLATGLDFSDPELWQQHLDSHQQRLRYKTYLDYGNYATQLDRYLEHFSRQQLLLLTTEQLAQDYAGTGELIWQFLQLEPLPFPPSPPRPQNTARSGPIGTVRRTLYGIPGIGALLRGSRRQLAGLLPTASKQQVKGWLQGLDRGEKPPMAAATRALLQDYYRDEMLRLQPLFGSDPPAWTEPLGTGKARSEGLKAAAGGDGAATLR